jgi:hypothetical protein
MDDNIDCGRVDRNHFVDVETRKTDLAKKP